MQSISHCSAFNFSWSKQDLHFVLVHYNTHIVLFHLIQKYSMITKKTPKKVQTPLTMEAKSQHFSLQSLNRFTVRLRARSVRGVAQALWHEIALLLCTVRSYSLRRELASKLSFHQWNLYTVVELLRHLPPVKIIMRYATEHKYYGQFP